MFEDEYGTLDQHWDRQMLARIDYELQHLNDKIGRANTPPKKAYSGPEPKYAQLPWRERTEE